MNKQCKECNEVKLVEDFYKGRAKCKKCVSLISSDWYWKRGGRAKIKKYKQLVGSVSLTNLKKEKVLTTYLRNKCKISSSNESFIYVTIETEDALTL